MAIGCRATRRDNTARRRNRKPLTVAAVLFLWLELLPACAGAIENRADSPHKATLSCLIPTKPAGRAGCEIRIRA